MKIAVVLFNLGGPDSLQAVRPFLFNLFNDPAILRLPRPLRWLLAWLISTRRDKSAQANYAKMGGRSPILPQTEAQAQALQAALAGAGGHEWRCFIAMRYWHPRAEITAREVKQWGAEFVVLLPLYPQYSTTTTASSLREWREQVSAIGLDAPSHAVCCYPSDTGMIEAMADRARKALLEADKREMPRALFSAHGLPKTVIEAGDPYRDHVDETALALAGALKLEASEWRTCFQSRVGPLEWIKPYTEDALREAAQDGKPVAVVPIAFVSEHVETLVELDQDYRELAHKIGINHYARAATVGTDERFIAGLAQLARQAVSRGSGTMSDKGTRRCRAECGGCAMAAQAGAR